MIFSPGEPNPFYDDYLYSRRLQSENNKWGIAFFPTIHLGLRVHVFVVNSTYITLNICTGHEPIYQFFIYQLVLNWLMTFDESVTEYELQKQFPYFEIKPIFNDPNWETNRELMVQRILDCRKKLEDSPAL